jgi:hypothetical protein
MVEVAAIGEGRGNGGTEDSRVKVAGLKDLAGIDGWDAVAGLPCSEPWRDMWFVWVENDQFETES